MLTPSIFPASGKWFVSLAAELRRHAEHK